MQVVCEQFGRFRRRPLRVVCVGAAAAAWLLVTAGVSQVRAETLQDALRAAYLNNPSLNAGRAELRATDEGVARARSGYRPRIGATGDVTYNYQNTDPSSGFDGSWVSRSVGVQLNQPLYQGGRIRNAQNEAEAFVQAGRGDLRAIETDVFLDVATFFMDVLRDQAIVRLQENNVEVLAEQLRATRDRFQVGEVTRTDVAQAEARLSGSRLSLSQAQSALRTSRAIYEQVVGQAPGNLVDPPSVEARLPHGLHEALSVAERENGLVIGALFREQAAQFAAKQVEGEFLPSAELEASYAKTWDPSRLTDRSENAQIVGRVTVPIYQAGEVSARLRQVKQVVVQRREEVLSARARVRADVSVAFGQLQSARAEIIAAQAQVEAGQIALNGVREEERVGQRTVLDVLDAEQDLLDARVSVVRGRRNLIVASYALLGAVGRLNAEEVGLNAPIYDPQIHYEEVRDKWYGRGPELEDWSHIVVTPPEDYSKEAKPSR